MSNIQNISVIIPSLDPDKRLCEVVRAIISVGFSDIILIDDGSRSENKNFFPTGEGITLLTHKKNLGKGEAIKTGLRYVTKNRPETAGVVTCDGDGQHLAEDVLSVCEKMLSEDKFILGTRDFSLPDVPKKSRIGNRLSNLLLAFCCGSIIHDTQTGLRAIPKKLLVPMEKVPGSRFEYETNVLLSLREMKADYAEHKIKTVYLDENKSSHFDPIKDTLRIFSRIFKYVASSFVSFLTDIVLFTIFHSVFSFGVLLSTITARIISSTVNFSLNRRLVFQSGVPLKKSLSKYYLVAMVIMLVSAFSVKGVTMLFSLNEGSIAATFIKIIVDILLFIVNYKIQQVWIFKSK